MRRNAQKSSRETRKGFESRSSERSKRNAPSVEQSTVTGKKRKISEDLSSAKKSNFETKVQRKVIGHKKADLYDTFCWICHKFADEFYCQNCPRVYHHKCIKKIEKLITNGYCECKWTGVDGSETQSELNNLTKLTDILTCTLNEVVAPSNNKKSKPHKYSEYFKIWPDNPENELLWHPMDLTTIEDTNEMKQYNNVGQFYQDVKKIYHNCYIIYGPDHDRTVTAQKFEKAMKQQLINNTACGECFSNMYAAGAHEQIRRFTKVCTNPHRIVWAKLKGFPFWPAKCLRIVNGHADVRFFGTHDKAIVPIAQVYKISRKNPSDNPKKPRTLTRTSTYELAMTELSIYITNYTDKYGSFVYAENKMPLETEKISVSKKTHQNKKQGESGYASAKGPNESRTGPLQLDVSALNDPGDTKFLHASTISKKITLNKDSAENIDVIQMSFSTDDGSPGDMQVISEVVEATSVSNSQLPAICIGSPNEIVLNNPEMIQPNSDNSFDTYDSNTAATSSPPIRITSTQSLNETVADYLRRNVPDCVLPSTSSDQSFNLDLSNELPPENDDDISLVREIRRSNNLVEDVMTNKPVTRTMCELLLSNKPQVRSAFTRFQDTCLQMMLLLFLQLETEKLEANDCKIFHAYYDKFCKALEYYQSHSKNLEDENENLKMNLNKTISIQEKKNAVKNEVVQALNKKNCEEINALRRENKELSMILDETKKTCQALTELKDSVCSERQILKASNDALENLVKENKEKIQDLKIKLHDSEEKNDSLKNLVEENKEKIHNLETKLHDSEKKCRQSIRELTEYKMARVSEDLRKPGPSCSADQLTHKINEEDSPTIVEETTKTTLTAFGWDSSTVLPVSILNSNIGPMLSTFCNQATIPQPAPMFSAPMPGVVDFRQSMMQSSSSNYPMQSQSTTQCSSQFETFKPSLSQPKYKSSSVKQIPRKNPYKSKTVKKQK